MYQTCSHSTLSLSPLLKLLLSGKTRHRRCHRSSRATVRHHSPPWSPGNHRLSASAASTSPSQLSLVRAAAVSHNHPFFTLAPPILTFCITPPHSLSRLLFVLQIKGSSLLLCSYLSLGLLDAAKVAGLLVFLGSAPLPNFSTPLPQFAAPPSVQSRRRVSLLLLPDQPLLIGSSRHEASAIFSATTASLLELLLVITRSPGPSLLLT